MTTGGSTVQRKVRVLQSLLGFGILALQVSECQIGAALLPYLLLR